mgnify:CR=1 FL=1
MNDSSRAPISVVLVDDDAMVRTALSMILGGAPEITVVGQAEDGRQGLSVIAEHSPDVVLMDIRMPRLDGLSATDELVRSGSPSKVIVLTTFDADDYVVRALAMGADGFLLKDTPPDDIVAAIHQVLDGRPALSPSVTAALIKQVVTSGGHRTSSAVERVDRLTARERDVAVELARGASNAEIAERLYMSLATVKAHISHIFTKLDAGNRVQVAILMHDAGMV